VAPVIVVGKLANRKKYPSTLCNMPALKIFDVIHYFSLIFRAMRPEMEMRMIEQANTIPKMQCKQ
jgi:hypothetical protein